jgi:hypothetical protein
MGSLASTAGFTDSELSGGWFKSGPRVFQQAGTTLQRQLALLRSAITVLSTFGGTLAVF